MTFIGKNIFCRLLFEKKDLEWDENGFHCEQMCARV